MTKTQELPLPIVERLNAPAYWMSGSSDGHEGENDAPRKAAKLIEELCAALEAAEQRLCELAPHYPPDGPDTIAEAEDDQKTGGVVTFARRALAKARARSQS